MPENECFVKKQICDLCVLEKLKVPQYFLCSEMVNRNSILYQNG